MKLLARLATGRVALWCTFWLLGIPLALVWDGSGACMVTGCRIERSWVAELVIGLFAAASVAMPFGAVVIWRSASNYPREAWWQTLLAMGAKLCAGFWGLLGILCILGFFYLAYGAISAVLAPD
jgi:hypothetical protein